MQDIGNYKGNLIVCSDPEGGKIYPEPILASSDRNRQAHVEIHDRRTLSDPKEVPQTIDLQTTEYRVILVTR
jgi:hypothetical protein